MTQFYKVKWLRLIILSLSCLLLVLTVSLSQATEQKQLKVAVEPVFAPFEFKSATGELQGFDVDLIRAIGEAAGFTVEFQTIAFDGIIPALQAGTVDAAVGAMTITPERARAVSFSRPYFKAGLAIAVQTKNQNIRSLDDLQGKKIAVQIGTTGAETAKKIPNADVRTFNEAVLALQELRNGNVDAVINDAPTTLYALRTGNLSGIRITGDFLTEEYYGIPTPLNSQNLPLINQGLTTILNDGTYQKIYQKWFNTQPPPLPQSIPGIEQTTQPANSLQFLSVIFNALPVLLAGALVTLALASISAFLGLLGGSLLGIARLSSLSWLRWIARAYVDFFRGTPLLVQIFMIYFGIPALIQSLGIQFTFDRFIAAVVALSCNGAAYIAEIVRAGIQSIELGQSEAARSLGLNPVQTMRYVIFPQALRRILPPLGNEFISLLKDTSLVAIIGFEELFRQGQLLVATTYKPFELYTAVAIIYLVLTLLSSQVFSYLEKVMDPARRSAKRKFSQPTELEVN